MIRLSSKILLKRNPNILGQIQYPVEPSKRNPVVSQNRTQQLLYFSQKGIITL